MKPRGTSPPGVPAWPRRRSCEFLGEDLSTRTIARDGAPGFVSSRSLIFAKTNFARPVIWLFQVPMALRTQLVVAFGAVTSVNGPESNSTSAGLNPATVSVEASLNAVTKGFTFGVMRLSRLS